MSTGTCSRFSVHRSSCILIRRRMFSPPSTTTNKRPKLSPVPTLSDHTVDQDIDGFLTPPPLSTAPSTGAVSEKPQVTIAMLRALAQGVLKPSR